MKLYVVLFLTLLILGCKEEPTIPADGILNESTQFAECNAALSACSNSDASYCLFGFKWGETNLLSNSGSAAVGPKEAGGTLTFSFQEENGIINTHAQINLPSKSFSSLPSCAKEEIREALREWSAAANIDFEELPENSQSDIRFWVAEIRQSGIGYPRYPDAPCSTFSGNVVIQENVRFSTCESFHLFLLHEIGHVLGLGHVTTANIMSPDFDDLNLGGLQAGDIRGLVELYGER
ncbi:MAG: matrixin family metalloprotease [Bacteroidota bacterium]